MPKDVNPCEWNQTQGTAPQTRVFASEILKGTVTPPLQQVHSKLLITVQNSDKRKKSLYVPLKACANIPIALSTVGCVSKKPGFYVGHVIGILLVDVSSGPRDIAGHLYDNGVTFEMTRSTFLRQQE